MRSVTTGQKDAMAIVLDPDEAALPSMAVENTLLKEISEELKQLDSLTSATSSGSANVISTHYPILLAFRSCVLDVRELTENSAAPCIAVSIT